MEEKYGAYFASKSNAVPEDCQLYYDISYKDVEGAKELVKSHRDGTSQKQGSKTSEQTQEQQVTCYALLPQCMLLKPSLLYPTCARTAAEPLTN